MRKSTTIKVPKASELVAADLRRQIITGTLKPGEVLPNEAALMREFGVSRPTLREAFRILESEAIITVLRGARGGGRVLEPDESVVARYMGVLLQYQGTPLSDVYRTRTELEVAAVGMLAGDGRRGALTSLEELVHKGAGLVEDDGAYAEHDLKFHISVVEAAGSPTLAALSRMLFRIIEAHNELFVASHPRGFNHAVNTLAQRGDMRLVMLLANGDVAAAQRHWRCHLDAVETYMVHRSESTLVEVLS